MSLKAFHILFIIASTLLSFGFAAWCLSYYFREERVTMYLVFGIGSLVAGVSLMVYGRYFLRKLKDVSYL